MRIGPQSQKGSHMDTQSVVRGRMLPGSLLIAGFALGCATPMSQFQVRNQSSQSLMITGEHSGDARASVDMVLPPGGSAMVSVREEGGFTGSIQANQQRWSTGAKPTNDRFDDGVAFVDDPFEPGRIRMVQLLRALRPQPLVQGMPRDLRADECALVNQTANEIVVLDLSRETSPGVIVEAMHSIVLPFALDGSRRYAVIRERVATEVVFAPESDRVFTIR